MNEITKIPPQATEIEEVFLGALLLEGERYTEINTLIPPEAFYKESNQIIYTSIGEVSRVHGKIDILTIVQKLKDTGKLDLVGGGSYIASLTSRVASGAHLKYHATIIYDKWVAREIIRIGSEMIEQAYTTDDVLDTIQQVRNAMDKRILHFLGINSVGIPIVEAAEQSIADYYTRENNIREGKFLGVPTSLNKINKLTGGLQPQQLIILAGRPGMGKTSVSMAFMLTAAMKGKKCAFFSLEMTSTRLMDKIICSLADVNHSDFKAGKLLDDQKERVNGTMAEIEKMDVTFNDEMIANIEQVHASCKMIKDRQGLDIVFIDYLQLMKTKEKTGNRENEISTISRKAKMLAVDLNVPVVLMSQLNRGVELRGDKEPMLSDLRESGAIEQDADIVMFVYRDSVYDETKPKDEGKIIIAKHREGAIGFAEFIHNESMTKFHDKAGSGDYDIDQMSPESERPF